MPKITKRVVDGLRPDPAGRETFLWDTGDGAIKGFGVRLMPTGVASYLIQYRTREGRTRRLALGRVGVLTPDEARRAAGARLKEVSGGDDPSADRQAARKAMTVAELCDWYLKDAKGRVKPSTLAMDASRIERHVKPLLGARSVAALTLGDLERLQAAVAAGKTARPREGRGGVTTGGRGVATRTVGMLGTILELARRHKLIAENPARGVRRFPDGNRTRFLSFEELAALGAAMRAAEAENRTGMAAIIALLLSGFRRNEALGLPWAWLTPRLAVSASPTARAAPNSAPSGRPLPIILQRNRGPRAACGCSPPTGATGTSWGCGVSWSGFAPARGSPT